MPWCRRRQTREVLYVMATRGREVNRLYVDTHFDPDPETSHGQTDEPKTAKDVLIGVLRNEGADVAAHDMMRRQQDQAVGNGAPGQPSTSPWPLPPRQSAGTPCWPAQDSPRWSCSRFVPVRLSEELTASLRRAEARAVSTSVPPCQSLSAASPFDSDGRHRRNRGGAGGPLGRGGREQAEKHRRLCRRAHSEGTGHHRPRHGPRTHRA